MRGHDSDEKAEALDTLGLRFGTDKCSSHHDYLRFYEGYFEPRRREAITLLEIGVATGASLSLWEAYFSAAAIIGADIEPGAARFSRGRVQIEIVDQSKADELVGLAQRRGPFDIIIDDGSHVWSHQILTLQTLFPHLADRGLYVIEDLETSYGALADRFRATADVSCAAYLKRALDLRVAATASELRSEKDVFLREHLGEMASLCFGRGVCLIQKSKAVSRRALLVAAEDDVAEGSLFILAHVGYWGDQSCGSWARGGGGDRNIQGFCITASDLPAQGLEYRARLASGAWTAWATLGTYVGTRGRGEDLTGLAARLVGPTAEGLELEVAGAFGAEGLVQRARNGADCFAPSGEPLVGMQLVLRRR